MVVKSESVDSLILCMRPGVEMSPIAITKLVKPGYAYVVKKFPYLWRRLASTFFYQAQVVHDFEDLEGSVCERVPGLPRIRSPGHELAYWPVICCETPRGQEIIASLLRVSLMISFTIVQHAGQPSDQTKPSYVPLADTPNTGSE